MRTDARVVVGEKLLDGILTDRSLWQLVNTACLPGVAGPVLAMPDIHEGYGFPIGGVVAARPDGVVSPGGVGYDINCGVRMLVSEVSREDFVPFAETVVARIFREVPTGLGRRGSGAFKMSPKEMDGVLRNGAQEVVRAGRGTAGDIEAIESGGMIAGARPDLVSERAKARGTDQLGTLGSGNHFVEIQHVDRIFDEPIARAWGLAAGRICVMIHTGSRGVGHQTCTDFVRRIAARLDAWGIGLPDRELACAPLQSPESRDYLGAMAACANFAWANRQAIAFRVREAWKGTLGKSGGGLKTLYDVAHNIAKVETHMVGGVPLSLVVHRKGATRAFPKNHPDLDPRFRATGQPVIIPGTMGTSSYVLVGTEKAMELSFGTVCHGAGRRLSRTAAARRESGYEVRSRLARNGVIVKCDSNQGLAEESPDAYKDVEEVVEAVEEAGLASRVARLRPLAVIKGG